ncbi:MAG TPA: hypothetical protein GX401_06210 [Clostridiales bacterium]|nr:hypothetical protein [Clostridiales bacterium]
MVLMLAMSSVGVCSAAAASRTYNGVTADYLLSSGTGTKMLIYGGSGWRYGAMAFSSNYTTDRNYWSNKKKTSGSTISLQENGIGNKVLCAGIGTNLNSNCFLFKYS